MADTTTDAAATPAAPNTPPAGAAPAAPAVPDSGVKSKVMAEIMASHAGLKGITLPVSKPADAPTVEQPKKPEGETKPNGEGGKVIEAEATVVPAEGAKPEGEEAEEEVKPGDSVEVQLEKLRKAQKRTLKRIDAVTAERNELQRKLEEGSKPEEPVVNTSALSHVTTLDGLKAEEKNIDSWISTLRDNSEQGFTFKGQNGQETTLSAKQVLDEILYWTAVKADQVPARRQFIESRDKTRQETTDKFKSWTTQKGFTEAKAAVEKTMQPALNALPDFDLAVHERALGRLAMSEEWELVPKRKVTPGSVESAPARKTPEAPPAAPPPSGGPPIKPAGTGPDVEALRQAMLKNPGSKPHIDAYIKAKVGAKS